MQPFIIDDSGVIRFKQNDIVRHLLDNGRLNLNDIAGLEVTNEDRCQFAQLIGYSLRGYHELSYVSDAEALAASEEARKLRPDAKGCRDDGCEFHCGVA